ncbi:O-methyltransferase family 2 [Neofusicoccum parvum]|uniref:O-methyltransferase family 2 n=1 Tax=Neofusicoccum parvum TaxID=310453 RepID=A0ACB5RT73_9PEZI|nr:O-methyltransferase family 2 [Neofusicoccum parvum]
MMEMAALRLLMDWDVFDKIPREPESISYAALSAKVDTEERLLKRMAWMLVSRGLLRQVGEDRVAHTKLSPIFAERESYALWFKFCYDNRGFVASRWPKYFARYGRKEPANTTHDNPVSFAHGKDDKSFWDIIDGESLQDFITSMTVLSKICPNVGIFPFRWIVENMDMVPPDAAIVVDVGGSYGEALQDIREECPEIAPDRMVLQDRPPVIEKVERQDPSGLKGMKKMSHDFFTEQPVKGVLSTGPFTLDTPLLIIL